MPDMRVLCCLRALPSRRPAGYALVSVVVASYPSVCQAVGAEYRPVRGSRAPFDDPARLGALNGSEVVGLWPRPYRCGGAATWGGVTEHVAA